MSYFDSDTNFFSTQFSLPEDSEPARTIDPVSFAVDLVHSSQRTLPRRTSEIKPRRVTKFGLVGSEKWGPVAFKGSDAVVFRRELTEKIVELRKVLSTANTHVTFPDCISDEASSYAPPVHGTQWEMFDPRKHSDFSAKVEAQEKEEKVRERAMFELVATGRKKTALVTPQRTMSIAWGDILSSDL